MKLMDKFPRILMSLFLALILAAGVAMISPHAAHAAGCSGTNCNGHDPYNYGCTSGSYVLLSKAMIDQFGNNDGTVQIWWSPTCQTNWGRVVMNTNNTNPWCVGLAPNQCWYSIGVPMYLLGFDSSGHYNGQETYLPLNTDGPDQCKDSCGGSTIFYGNMYYAPNAEIAVRGQASSLYPDGGTTLFPQACVYTGAAWKYSNLKPAC